MLLFLLFSFILLVVLSSVTNNFGISERTCIGVLFFILVYKGFSFCNAADTEGYMTFFYQIKTNGWVLDSLVGTPAVNMEPGLFIIMQICKKVVTSYYFFQFVMLSIDVVLLFYGLKRLFNDNNGAIVFILLFAMNLTMFLAAMRQGVVIALFICCIPFIVDHKWSVYLPVFISSVFFHQTGIFLLIVPILWIVYSKFSNSSFFMLRWIPLAIFIICNLCYFTGISAQNLIFSNFGNIMIEDSLSTSRSLSLSEEALQQSNYGLLKIIELNFCFIICFFTEYIPKTKQYDFLKGLFVLFFMMNMLVGGIVVHRFNYYLNIPYYILLFETIRCVLKYSLNLDSVLSNVCIYFYMLGLFMIQAGLGSDFDYSFHLIDIFE